MIVFFQKSKFKADLMFSYVAQGSTVILGLLQVYLINKYFGVSTYGQLAIIMSTAGIFSSLLTARSSEAVTRFFKREELNSNYGNAKFIIFIGFGIDFITAIILLLLVYIFSKYVAITFLKDQSLALEIIIYSFITFFVFLRDSLTGYMQAREMFTHINSLRLLESSLKILFLTLSITLMVDLTLKSLVYSFLAASVLSFFCALSVFFKDYLTRYREINIQINSSLFKEYWRFNIKTFLSSSLKAGNENIDNLIIAYFLDTKTVGIYQILKKVLSPIGMFSAPFSMLIYPKLIRFYEAGQRNNFKKIIIKTSFYIAALAIGYSFITCVFLQEILVLLGTIYISEYTNYYLILVLWTLLVSMMWWVRIFSNTVDPNYSLYMNIFATLFQLTITISMARTFGLYGLLISIAVMNLLIITYWIMRVMRYVR